MNSRHRLGNSRKHARMKQVVALPALEGTRRDGEPPADLGERQVGRRDEPGGLLPELRRMLLRHGAFPNKNRPTRCGGGFDVVLSFAAGALAESPQPHFVSVRLS